MADSQDTDWNGGYSGARVRRKIAVTSAVTICDGIIDALLAAGWEDRGPTAARAFMAFPFGVPVTTVPLEGETRSTLFTQQTHHVQGDIIYFYDPYSGSPDLRPNALWVPMGLTIEAGFLALEGVINGSTDWHITSRYIQAGTGVHIIELEANVSGTAWNTTEAGGVGAVSGIGFWGGGTFTGVPHDGGGQVLRANSAAGWLEAWVFATGVGARIEFTASTGGVTPSVDLVPAGAGGFGATELTLIANQFQFALWTAGRYDTVNNVLASLPYIEPGKGITYAAIVIKNFRGATQWQSGGEWSAVNGGFELTGRFHGRVVGLYEIYSLLTLTDAVGMAIAEPAFLGAPITGSPRTRAGHARIIGRMWDAYTAHRQGDGFDRDNRTRGAGNLRYQCIAKNTTPYWCPGSLWLAYGGAEEPEDD